MVLALGTLRPSLSILRRLNGVESFGHLSPGEKVLRAMVTSSRPRWELTGQLWVGPPLGVHGDPGCCHSWVVSRANLAL